MKGMPMNKIIAGMVWYRSEDYEHILKIMEDAAKLPRTYKSWLLQAEANEKMANYRGFITVRAFINPEIFPDWCRRHGHNIDADARNQFANTVAKEAARNA